MGGKQHFEMGAIDLPDDTGVQLWHQIGKAQVYPSRMLKIIHGEYSGPFQRIAG